MADTSFTRQNMEGSSPVSGHRPRGEWRKVRLRDITLRTKQFDPRRNPLDEIEYVDVSSVSRESLTIQSSTRYPGADAPGRARKKISSGDVLFATVRPSLRRVALVPTELEDQFCSTAFCVIRADPEQADPKFLFFVISSEDFVRQVSSRQRGSSYPAVTDKDVLEQEIQLPPLAEQRIIANVLAAIQQSRAATAKVIAASREIKRSLMRYLFTYGLTPVASAEDVELRNTELGQLPRAWPLLKVEDVSTNVTVGIVVRPASYYVEDGVPAFRSLNVREDRLVTDDLVFIDRESHKHKLSKSALTTGDVLVVRTGYPGTSCVVPPEYNGANCIDLVIVRPNSQIITSEYLSRYFNSEPAKRQFVAAKVGLAQQHLNVSALKRTLLPVPTLSVQREIGAALRAVDRKIEVAIQRKDALDQMLSSAVSEIMTGHLTIKRAEAEVG